MLSIFQRQRRYVTETNMNDALIMKYFTNTSKATLSVQSMSSWRTFLHLSQFDSLRVFFLESSQNKSSNFQKSQAKSSSDWRFWHHIKKASHLKHLSLHFLSTISELKVNIFLHSLEKSILLDNLETLTLFLNHLTWKEPRQFYFPKILARTTTLKVFEVSSQSLQQIISSFNMLENLSNLSIIKLTQSPEDDDHLVEFTGLAALIDLHKLQSIDISINLSSPQSLKSFLRFYSLPKSIESVKIALHEVAWGEIIPDFRDVDLKTENRFRCSNICGQFFEQWKNLPSLHSLSLCFAEDEADSIPSLYFTVLLLNRLHRLDMFYYSSWSSRELQRRKAFDFGYFWQEISGLRSRLKKIYIESYAITLRHLKEYPHETTRLEELGFNGFVLGDTSLTKLLPLLKKDSPQELRRSVLDIQSLVIGDGESFQRFLENLKVVSRRSKIHLNVDIRKIEAEIFVEILCRSIEDMPTNKNLFLSFRNAKPIASIRLQDLSKSLGLRRTFGDLVIVDQTRTKLFSYKQLEGQPILKDEIMEDTNFKETHIGLEDEFSIESTDQSLDDELSDEESDELDYPSSVASDELDCIDEDL